MFINILSVHFFSTFVACDSDKGIKAYNMDPQVTISSHAFGSVDSWWRSAGAAWYLMEGPFPPSSQSLRRTCRILPAVPPS